MDLLIKTERLIIKPFDYSYLEDYCREFTDEITKYQYPDSFKDIETAREFVSYFYDEMNNGKMLELVILTPENEFIGSMEAFSIEGEAPEVGLWLKKSAHGKGYGYEALRALINYLDSNKKYKHYIYEVDQRNTQSIHLVNKFINTKGNTEEVITESNKKLTLDAYYIYTDKDSQKN